MAIVKRLGRNALVFSSNLDASIEGVWHESMQKDCKRFIKILMN